MIDFPHQTFLLEFLPFLTHAASTLHPMFIEDYFNEQKGTINFTREHASNFAKHIADDFNPIHDIDSKRFCVPGDLLFSIVLAKYGLSQHMAFVFSGMVQDGVDLLMPEDASQLHIKDNNGREYLSITRSGDNARDEKLIQNLTRNYVAFSGHTFPHILVPLTAEKNLMINPARPMVIYQSMSIDMDRLDIHNPSLEIDHNELTINGKRGNVLLAFNIVEAGEVVGRGKKHMILSGLIEYDKSASDAAIASFKQRKEQYFS